MSPPTRRRAAAAVVAFLAVAGVLTTPAHARSATAPRPNILFVLTDDMALSDLAVMPNTRALIAAQGATFDNYFVNSSLCCPSRATTLRGQYEHNTGVEANGGINGGFEKMFRAGLESDTIATRLRAAGYRTGLFGKYLNGYPLGAPVNYVPPGWTSWASAVRGNPYAEYDYVLNQDAADHTYGHDRAAYGTDVYLDLAQGFIGSAAHAHRPFFAYLAVYAPHQPATPAPEDAGTFATATVPRTPAFDQADVNGSPRFVRDLPPFSPAEAAAIDHLHRLRLESLQAVDRGVARLVSVLRATGQLANTFIVFASDNGFHLGQHRLPAGKQTAYETDVHVPLLVRGPGIPRGSHVGRLAGNVDLAPTFAAIAHTRPALFTDGRSLLGLLRGDDGPSTRWRRSFLVEHRGELHAGRLAPAAPEQRSTLEPDDPDQAVGSTTPDTFGSSAEIRDRMLLARRAQIPDYDAVRTQRYMFVEYHTGERELFDVQRDPDEVDNLAGQVPTLQRSLERRIAALRNCRAATCRHVEQRSLH